MIALDTYSTGAQASPGSAPITWNHICSGQDRVLFVIGKGNGVVTGITYGGVALTKLASVADSSYGTMEIWGLLNPPAGTNQVSASWTGSQFVDLGSVSYTGVKQTGLPNAIATNANVASVNTITTNITTTVASCWLLACTVMGGGLTPSAGVGQVKRFQGLADVFMVGDSNGNVSAGSNAMQTNISGTSTSVSMVIVSFESAPDDTMQAVWF